MAASILSVLARWPSALAKSLVDAVTARGVEGHSVETPHAAGEWLAANLRDPASVDALCGWVRAVLETWQAGSLVSVDPGPPAPHGHVH